MNIGSVEFFKPLTKSRSRLMRGKVLIFGLLFVVFCIYSLGYTAVPQMINYQGKITTPGGALVDTTVQMIFTIYDDSTTGNVLWADTISLVSVQKGIFSVLLGSGNPIPDSVFDGNIRYLGTKVGTDAEMTPRKAMVSVAYAYRSETATVADSVANGGAMNCEGCDDRFVNVDGPDSVVSGSGTAFLGKVVASTEFPVYGIKGYACNNDTATGDAYGGYFETSPYGGGSHYGVRAEGYGSTDSSTYGTYSYAENTSSGWAYGGYFKACSSGTGTHYGVYSQASGKGSDVFGCYSSAENTSMGMGNAIAGYFITSASGVGDRYGIYASGRSSSDSYAYGVHGGANQTSTGDACGISGIGHNNSSGDAYGGKFSTTNQGTGDHYGVSIAGGGNSSADVYGCHGSARNYGSGSVYAGYFYAYSVGTGTKYGIYAEAPTDQSYAGYFQGDVRISDSLVVLGGKSAAVKVDNGEYRLLYSQESPEVWFEDFGEGQLMNGRAHIELDPLFLRTVTINSQNPMKVFIQLTSGDPITVVTNKGTTGFDVIASDNTSSATFDYRVVAKRKGFEDIRLAKMGGPTPEEVAVEQAKHLADLERERMKINEQKAQMEEYNKRTDDFGQK